MVGQEQIAGFENGQAIIKYPGVMHAFTVKGAEKQGVPGAHIMRLQQKILGGRKGISEYDFCEIGSLLAGVFQGVVANGDVGRI